MSYWQANQARTLQGSHGKRDAIAGLSASNLSNSAISASQARSIPVPGGLR